MLYNTPPQPFLDPPHPCFPTHLIALPYFPEMGHVRRRPCGPRGGLARGDPQVYRWSDPTARALLSETADEGQMMIHRSAGGSAAGDSFDEIIETFPKLSFLMFVLIRLCAAMHEAHDDPSDLTLLHYYNDRQKSLELNL